MEGIKKNDVCVTQFVGLGTIFSLFSIWVNPLELSPGSRILLFVIVFVAKM